MKTPGRALAFLVLAFLLLAFPGAPAPGGGRALGQVDTLLHPASRQSVRTAQAILALDAGQAADLDTAYAKYRAAYKAAVDDLRAKCAALIEKGRGSGKLEQAERQVGVLSKAALEALDTLDAAFLADAKALLTPEQAPRFAAFEHARRREGLRTVRVYGGDNIDLIDILDAQKVAWRGDKALAPLVEAYDSALDPLLRERDTQVREMLDPVAKTPQAEVLPRLYAAAAKMRECNRQNAKAIAAALPEASRAAFAAEILRRSYPRTFADSNFARALAAARAMPDLSDAQKGKVEALARDYERDAALASIALAQAIDRVHDLLAAAPEKVLSARDVDTTGVTKPREARRDLDKKFQARLEEILTKDQRAHLPPPRPPTTRGGDFEPTWDEEGLKAWMDEDAKK